MQREIFGPVLHVATYRADGLDRVIADINARGFGLTFGLHSRIDSRVQHITQQVHAGNLYVNRNQIGAVVGSQPFGGEGLSGTGPKAGGPLYLPRFFASPAPQAGEWDGPADLPPLPPVPQAELSHRLMPGPTGELNRLGLSPRGPVLCLGPGRAAAARQAQAVTALGGVAVAAGGLIAPEALSRAQGLAAAIWWGDAQTGRAYAQALAGRDGPLLPLIGGMPDAAHVLHERHLCVDTTAAGGNAALMAG